MDKREQRTVRTIYILMLLGFLLAIVLVIFNHGGLSWLTDIDLSGIGWLGWLSIAILFFLGIVLQYLVLMGLRYSKLKYIILWGIPIFWFFNNGIIAMSRFLDWITDIGVTVGWLSFADLISWLTGIVFSPALISIGAIAAVLDSGSVLLNQSCYYARMAMDIANVSPWQVIDYTMNILSILWDLLANSFTQEVIRETSSSRSLFEFSMGTLFSLPQWLTTLGYSCACLAV